MKSKEFVIMTYLGDLMVIECPEESCMGPDVYKGFSISLWDIENGGIFNCLMLSEL